MNRWEREVAASMLDSEEAAIKELERQYARALRDIEARIKMFDYDIKQLQEAINSDGLDDAAKAVLKSQQQAKIYQKQYQQALKGQISGVLDNLHAQQYKTIEDYLKSCYTAGYVGTMYDLAQQGIPLVIPIDQAAVVKAVLTDSKIVEGYYQHLGVDYARLKKLITTEISRGIASGLSYAEMSRNLHNVSGSGLSNARRIVRTEGHRIQQTSADDARRGAIAKGADVLKQWSAALDSRTRDSHARVDGEIREEDEKFSNGLMFPGDPAGRAEEVINCRCVATTRARWGLDESELETLKERAEYFGLDKTESFEDFQNKYLKAVKDVENSGNDVIMEAPKEMSERFAKLPNDLTERSKEIGTILNDYSARKSKWSGQTIIGKRENMRGTSGRKEWTCAILLREDSGIKTAIHEHLHARSVSYYTPKIYKVWENIEEGVIELYAQEICKRNGVAYSGSYSQQVKQLRIANSIMRAYANDFDFAKAIFEIDLPERYAWLRSEADKVISKGVLTSKTKQALNAAVDYFIGKV